MNVQPIGPSSGYTSTQAGPANAMSLDKSPEAALRAAQSSEDSQAIVPTDPLKSVAAAQRNTDPKTVEDAVEEVQEFVDRLTHNLKFALDDDSGEMVVKIIDRQTDEVLRQIPSEEMLEISRALDKLRGLFVEQTA